MPLQAEAETDELGVAERSNRQIKSYLRLERPPSKESCRGPDIRIVVVETDEGPIVLGGDVGHWFEELERGETPGQQLVLELAAPTYLAHVAEVRVPQRQS